MEQINGTDKKREQLKKLLREYTRLIELSKDMKLMITRLAKEIDSE